MFRSMSPWPVAPFDKSAQAYCWTTAPYPSWPLPADSPAMYKPEFPTSPPTPKEACFIVHELSVRECASVVRAKWRACCWGVQTRAEEEEDSVDDDDAAAILVIPPPSRVSEPSRSRERWRGDRRCRRRLDDDRGRDGEARTTPVVVVVAAAAAAPAAPAAPAITIPPQTRRLRRPHRRVSHPIFVSPVMLLKLSECSSCCM